MELLLNLAWLLLALPAYWIWRGVRHQASSRQCLLTLACMLTLLFPIISATDDLHAMRAEMEESGTGKRSVRQAGDEKASAWINRLHSPVAVAAGNLQQPTLQAGLLQLSDNPDSGLAIHLLAHAGRAPPVLPLA